MPPTFWERQWVFTTSAKSSDLAGNRRRAPLQRLLTAGRRRAARRREASSPASRAFEDLPYLAISLCRAW